MFLLIKHILIFTTRAQHFKYKSPHRTQIANNFNITKLRHRSLQETLPIRRAKHVAPTTVRMVLPKRRTQEFKGLKDEKRGAEKKRGLAKKRRRTSNSHRKQYQITGAWLNASRRQRVEMERELQASGSVI